MNEISRRDALKLSLFGCATLFAGCGGGSSANSVEAPVSPTPAPSPTPTPAPPPAPSSWNVSLPALAAGSGVAIDLSATLPADVARGGTFAVSPQGPSLPQGMTLSPAGTLSVGTASAGQTTGVIFSYTV